MLQPARGLVVQGVALDVSAPYCDDKVQQERHRQNIITNMKRKLQLQHNCQFMRFNQTYMQR